MVGTIFVYMDYFMGTHNAATKAHAPKDKTTRIYDSVRFAWFSIWNTLCTFSGDNVWIGFSGDDCMDYCRYTI